MSVCVPVRDMKDTAAFTALVNKEREVTVTKNGYDAIHCMSDDYYRAIQEEVAKAKLFSRMMLAESELESHDYCDFDDFATSIRDTHGI